MFTAVFTVHMAQTLSQHFSCNVLWVIETQSSLVQQMYNSKMIETKVGLW